MPVKHSSKLVIIRHGQTYYNRDHRLDGQFNTQLTPLGIQQAKVLGMKLARYNFDYTISSPLDRAVNTVKNALGNDVEINTDSQLLEIDCGACTGMTKEAIEKEYPLFGT